ncbi:MAG: chromate efflux transporter [Proteobacteria bacterium]|nr:chromate efflux transporter [Pseudomonadota bacterium]
MTDQAQGEQPHQPEPPRLRSIFALFFRIGLTAFGGPAMIPVIRAAVVERLRWLRKEEFRLGLSLCQAIPGATVMQLAAYTGLQLRGVSGAFVAYLGFALPAFCLVTGLSAAYFQLRSAPFVGAVFAGLQVVVLALLSRAAWDFGRRYANSAKSLLLLAGAAGLFLWGLGPALIVAGMAGVGALVFKDTAPHPSGGNHHMLPWRFLAQCAALAAVILPALFLFDRPVFDLVLSMFKIDLVAFGGVGAFPVMQHEVVQVRAWMPEATFLDGIALGQVTPGPILMTAAFIGYSLAGLWGAAAATIAVFTPSFLMLVTAVPFAHRLLASDRFRGALAGALATLGGLLCAMVVMLAMTISWTVGKGLLGVAVLVALARGMGVHWVVLAAAFVSLLAW